MSRVYGKIQNEKVKRNYHPPSRDYESPLHGSRKELKKWTRAFALSHRGNYDTETITRLVIEKLNISAERVWVMRKGHNTFSGTVIYGAVSRILSMMARDHQIMRPNQTEDANWVSDGIYCAIKSTSSGPKPLK